MSVAGAHDANARENGAGGIQAVARTFEILEVIANAGGRLSLTHIAEYSGLPTTTVHRTIRTLVSLGYIRQDDTKTYSLGPHLIFIGRVASVLLGSWARPHLAKIVDLTNETASLGVMDQDEVVFIAEVPSQRVLRSLTDQGRRVPAHSTALGKALLSQLDEVRITEVSQVRGLAPLTDRTITSLDRLFEEINTTRARGYAIDDGEHEIGMRSIAVPVLNGPRNMALAISGPDTRLDESSYESVATVMQAVAEDLAEELAMRDPDT